jgi:hypothetical protein
MASIHEDIEKSAKWISVALTSSGYRADFSPESLWEIDRFFDEQSRNGAAVGGGLLSQNFGQRIFAVGAYMGEVIRKRLGGIWVGGESDPEIEINVALQLPAGTICWPVRRAMKRLKNGAEDGVAAWGSALGLHVGNSPRPRSGFIRRLLG